MTTPSGLRDQKKAATRAALGASAIQLGRIHGFETVTAEAIARDAGVSTRTFHNYFSSKEEAVLYYLEVSALEWVDRLRSRPADEDLWTSMRHIVYLVVDDPDRELGEVVAVAKMVESTPSLLAKKLELHETLTHAFTVAIAERTGLDAERDLYPRLLQSVLGAAVNSALTVWDQGDSYASSHLQVVEQALRQLEAGLSSPVPLPDPAHS